MHSRVRCSIFTLAFALSCHAFAAAQDRGTAPASQPAPPTTTSPGPDEPTAPKLTFDLGEIVVVGSRDDATGIGGAVISHEQIWRFDRQTLDRAVNIVPGVVSTFDANGRRNESDVFVRGFGRWQVPLMIDGVRVYLPADNRLDFGRFLTADVAAIQIQKGYASVLDGPGAMGGAINLVSRKPTKALEVEASASLGGRTAREGWNAAAMVGTRQEKYYLQGSVAYTDRDFWTLSGRYEPPARSLQPEGRRLSSDSSDHRVSLKGGFTPNDRDEYVVNFMRQSGDKGAPLNVYNNPPVPPNSYWRWPWWDLQNVSFLSHTQLGATTYVETKAYYNTFTNGLDAFDDATYTTQSANGRFRSPYDDHASGGSVLVGTTQGSANTLKAVVHYRADTHVEQQVNRPTHPTLSTTEPEQEQAQRTWALAVEDTWHLRPTVDIVGGVSYERSTITKAQEFSTARGLFEYPHGGSGAPNGQAAAIWRYRPSAQVHASVSDRSRFPVIFERYSTRFGTATPNPGLGPERATNLEIGWKGTPATAVRIEAAIFYSRVRDLIQTVVLPDTTTQTQNVGNGHFHGVEIGIDARVVARLHAGGNYTAIRRTIRDALQPNLRPTGVPTHKAFLYATWTPVDRLTVTPSLDLASDRWSDLNPAPAFPYLRTGRYTLFDLSAEYAVRQGLVVVAGVKNAGDDSYELAWGFPQPGRSLYVKARIGL